MRRFISTGLLLGLVACGGGEVASDQAEGEADEQTATTEEHEDDAAEEAAEEAEEAAEAADEAAEEADEAAEAAEAAAEEPEGAAEADKAAPTEPRATSGTLQRPGPKPTGTVRGDMKKKVDGDSNSSGSMSRPK